MKKRLAKTHFTLLEIIVAMGVFSILVMVLMQFFTGAQKIWVGTENKNESYADARAAMNLMANLLQNNFYSAGEDMEGRTPFQILHNNSAEISDKIYFVTQSPLTVVPDTKYNLSFIAIQRDKTALKILGSSDGIGAASFVSNILDTKNNTWDNLFTQADQYPNKAVVIDRVTNIKFFPGKLNGNSISWFETISNPDQRVRGVPEVIRIELTVIDKEGYEKWVAKGGGDPGVGESTEAKEFRKPYERKFSRVVHLKSRNYAP